MIYNTLINSNLDIKKINKKRLNIGHFLRCANIMNPKQYKIRQRA
jgi:hypothetical protein